jgi:DUF4097 and DUF4098 domain-containing protein YvlB
MNKQEFIAELSKLLKVKAEDKQSIIEEYENYFQESLAAGELESDIIASLETPAQIAQNANAELGVDPKAKYHENDEQETIKEKYNDWMDSEFFDNLEKDIEKAFNASEKAVKQAAKAIDKTVRKIDFKAILDNVMDSVDKVVDKASSFDFKGRVDEVAMRFDQSKVETYQVSDDHLHLKLEDPNSESLVVELVPGQQALMVKYLPTNLKCEITLDRDVFQVSVEPTSIKFIERKRMRIYIPESVKTLTVEGNCPISFNDVDVASTINITGAPIVIKKMMAEHVMVTATNNPISIKHSQIDHIKVIAGSGPITLKDIKSNKLQLHHKNGSVSLRDLLVQSLWINGENGPKSLKDIVADEITLQVTGGPLNLTDCKAKRISGDVSGTLLHQSDCSFEDNQLVTT